MPQYYALDANEAVARVAYSLNETIAIYPITPSSPMGEWADQWAAEGRKNAWDTIPEVMEMQSEGGAAGAVHGALTAGSLATTFTASQGLLLMIPNLYKIAGELTPFVIHVAARTVATHALSIFGDHSDVMACRQTGMAQLASGSVQEAQDMALIAQSATLQSRIPIMHFFDGFRTSHEVQKIELLPETAYHAMISDEWIAAHRERALTPDRPMLRGTAQNPDVFFQAREAANPYYRACPEIMQRAMDAFADHVGRHYHLFDYSGAADADRVIIIMGSGGETAEEASARLNREGEKTGVLKVRLYRPWSAEAFLDALPPTVQSIAVLDRTKEPGATGEPLYLDVVTCIAEAMGAGKAPFDSMPRVIGGRYGLSSKEFTPAMAKAVYEELKSPTPRNHFTVGIHDDVTHTSLDWDPEFTTEEPETVRAVFYGLGSDGTVGANKNTIKIIAEQTDHYAQGYFVYDSKKSGATTVSHLRFGPKKIHSPYLIDHASFVACHQFSFMEKIRVLKSAAHGATFLLNSPYGPEEVWDRLPRPVQEEILEKELRFYVIDALAVAKEAQLGRRINTVMQAAFFAISGVLPRDEAIAAIKTFIEKTYGKRGRVIVDRNFAAVDSALDHLYEVKVPGAATSEAVMRPPVPANAPDFVRELTARIILGEGDSIPVSAFPADGTFPIGTTKYEKRCIASEIPVWDPDVCIQCGKCVLACPHGVIRGQLYGEDKLKGAPEGFLTTLAKWPEHKGMHYTLEISPDDCTGCHMCVEVCPAKNKSAAGRKAINMEALEPIHEEKRRNWDYFLTLPNFDRHTVNRTRVKDVQLLEPLFEFSGACAGCGETPYLKLLTQLFGDRVLAANATGCSSIYGGNLPTTPWSKNSDGRGPAWSNSLFEDNAEFGLGMRLAVDRHEQFARELVEKMASRVGRGLAKELLEAPQTTEKEIEEQRNRVADLKQALTPATSDAEAMLLTLADYLVKKSLWIIGGDGWAYDIGFGGLDHVIASGRNVNILVLDTEVYSNTGGQSSKATPRAAVAKFAASGKPAGKKDMGLYAMSYGNAYVARIAMGASDVQTIRAFREAEAWEGPSIILAYSHCIAHGYDMRHGFDQQKAAVESGHWPLFRFNPAEANGRIPLTLDSKKPKIRIKDYAYSETRYSMLALSQPDRAQTLIAQAQADADARWLLYEHLAGMGKSSD